MRLLVLPSGAILEHGAIREQASAAVVEEVSMSEEANIGIALVPSIARRHPAQCHTSQRKEMINNSKTPQTCVWV